MHRLPTEQVLAGLLDRGIVMIEPHYPIPELLSYLGPHGAFASRFRTTAWGVPQPGLSAERNRDIVDAAKAIGTRIVNCDPEAGSLWMVQSLARTSGLAFAIHPHGPGHRYPGWRCLRDLLTDVDNLLGICYDIGHIARSGDDVLKGIVAMDQKLHSVHLKDVDAEGKDCILGHGVLPLRKIFHALADVGFDGPVALEWEGNLDDPWPGLLEGYRLAQELAREVEFVEGEI